MKKIAFIFSILIVLGVTSLANADLTGFYVGTDHFVYDSTLNITWYDYTYQRTSFSNANNWVNTLTVAGVSDWSLWTAVDGPIGNPMYYDQGNGSVVISHGVDGTTTLGFNIITNYMGYLYYVELGNKGYLGTDGMMQDGYGPFNMGPFINIQPSGTGYWSGTESAFVLGNAFNFSFAYGTLGLASTDIADDNTQYAMAVYEGDIRTVITEPPCYDDDNHHHNVPEYATILLFGLGLIGLAGMRRRLEGKK